MAGFRTHITVSTLCGVVYGGAAVNPLGFPPETAFLVLCYVFVRYALAWALKQVTVHRGMFHSIPAMLIAGLCVYLAYHNPKESDRAIRVLLACGMMLGFLSHLILDEVYSVDWRGVKPKLKASAGSAFKFGSTSLVATATCYAILGGLLYLAYLDYTKSGGDLGF